MAAYRKDSSGVLPVALVAAGAFLLAHPGAGAETAGHGHHAAPAVSRAPAKAIAFAATRVGRVPYLWGGTSDKGMDCSGLVMKAYASAGVRLERTSQQQWASEKHVSAPRPGDLVFFAGSDGTPTAPGHVGLVTGKNKMIDAYGAGTFVRTETYGLPTSAPGLRTVAGFTRPEAA